MGRIFETRKATMFARWDKMSKAFARIGKEVGYTRSGILFTCADDQSYAEHERWKANLDEYPVRARMVSGTDLAAVLPGAERLRIKGAQIVIHRGSDED